MSAKYFLMNPARQLVKLCSRNAGDSISNSKYKSHDGQFNNIKQLDGQNEKTSPPACDPNCPVLHQMKSMFTEHEKKFAEHEMKFAEYDEMFFEHEERIRKLEYYRSYQSLRETLAEVLKNKEESDEFFKGITGGKGAVEILYKHLDELCKLKSTDKIILRGPGEAVSFVN